MFDEKEARIDVIQMAERQVLSSASIVGIAVGGVLLLLLIIDLLCCATINMGVLATMCRRTKRSPSEIDEEAKLGSIITTSAQISFQLDSDYNWVYQRPKNFSWTHQKRFNKSSDVYEILYGWRFPLPYCSGQLVKEPPPSPLPLPPPVKLGGSALTTPSDEKQPLQTPTGSIKQNSTVEFDGKFVHSRSGEIIGKNSAV
uniref:Uncharacterized protein n=1 Tax=Glossina brevipalpis TaxID=37001 RepID=A0A1A9X4L3_9MUSC